jgi:hypothetical protein
MAGDAPDSHTLEDWATRLLGHVLTLAATEVSARDRLATFVEVPVSFRVQPIEAEDRIEISLLIDPHSSLTAYVARPF